MCDVRSKIVFKHRNGLRQISISPTIEK